jgi:hypothetical protein
MFKKSFQNIFYNNYNKNNLFDVYFLKLIHGIYIYIYSLSRDFFCMNFIDL